MSRIKSHIKQSFTLLVCGALSFVAKAGNDGVTNFVSSPQFKHASISLYIKDLTNNKVIASYNPQQSLTPASILKVMTTASAIELLGDNFRFETTLATDKNDAHKLIIHGHGDPTLGSEYIGQEQNQFLNTWINHIKKNVNSDSLNILVVDDYFGYLGQSRKWIKEDMGNYYAAGSYGISVFDNAYKLYFDTTEDKAKIVKTDPQMSGLLFSNYLNLNNSNQDNGYILGEPFSKNRQLIGDIPRGKTSFSIKGDIPDPGIFLAETLATSLRDNGINISSYNTIRVEPQQYAEKVFYTHQSPPLKDIIRVVNVRSNNHYAEHIIRAIGRSNGTKPDEALTSGIKSVKDLWEKKGFDVDGLSMFDGCGLAPSNAVNSSFMCDILTAMKDNDAFITSLPKAGKEGTVRNFLKGSRLEGKVIVKSGSIGNVQCFAGYYLSENKQYAFTVMVNNFNGSHRETVKAIEKLLLSVF